MNHDQFSDTTELPVPREPHQPQEPEYSDPFAAPPRRRTYSDGMASGEATRRTERPNEQYGYGAQRRTNQPNRQSGYGTPHRTSYPNGQSANGTAPRRRLNGAAGARSNGHSVESTPQRNTQQAPRQRMNQDGTAQRPFRQSHDEAAGVKRQADGDQTEVSG